MKLVPDTKITRLDEIHHKLFDAKGLRVIMARLDLIHPIISGNKLFKLHYFLQTALNAPSKTIVTFGGAYSNHLVATAYAGSTYGLKTIGYVRGEEPELWSHTLIDCRAYGMELHFVSRENYKLLQELDGIKSIKDLYPGSVVVPEGGYAPIGASGASLIVPQLSQIKSSHIITAVGTATTLAGILMGSDPTVEVIAVPVIKNMEDIYKRLSFLTAKTNYENLTIWDGFHGGGYAKYQRELIDFINIFYREFDIPLDFVYTGKMMLAVFSQIEKNYFKPGSTIVCLHTGGLQGNLSLPAGTLAF